MQQVKPWGRAHVRSAFLCALALGVVGLASGCKIMSIEEDEALRARREGHFDAQRFISGFWDAKAVPELNGRAVPVERILMMPRPMPSDLASRGRKVSQGSDWAFVVEGEGAVVAVDDKSRVGAVTIALDDGRRVQLLTGPVLVSTAVRDAVATLRFDDFSDQIAFAAVNRALNDKVLQNVRRNPALLKVGARTRFMGVIQFDDGGIRSDAIPNVVPVQLTVGKER